MFAVNVPMHKSQRLINHVALVLDGSGSMDWLANKVVQVADQQIHHLKTLSDKFNQETRVSVYLFDHEVHCLIFDQDVARLPSIKELYKTGGYTAIIDALVKSQRDLATTSQIYGDYAFLTYVLTDGDDNRSKHVVTAVGIEKVRQDEFVEKVLGRHFVCGKGYYQFTKAELVQGDKDIIVVEKATGQAYK